MVCREQQHEICRQFNVLFRLHAAAAAHCEIEIFFIDKLNIILYNIKYNFQL